MNFAGKVCIITGASSGIGKATAIELAHRGVILILISRSKEKLGKVRKEIKNKNVSVYPCDVVDNEKISSIISSVINKFGKIDILINCAGFGVYEPFIKQKDGDIRRLMEVNYFGIVNTCRQTVPIMIKQGYGHIANVSSMAGRIGFAGYSGYCASKFAVSGFTESLNEELHGTGVKVHLICPSGTNTNFFNHPSFKNHYHRRFPEKLADPKVVSNAIIDAIEKNKFEVNIGFLESVFLKGKYIFPDLFRWIQRVIRKRRGYE